jgi:rhodanese-related sulfurtransferase
MIAQRMFKSLFGTGGSQVDLGRKIKEGATIVDVRTPQEFQDGHATGAINIPLDRLNSELGRLDRGRPVITCCRSGARSGAATDILRSEGFDVYNGGPWQNVQAKLP